MKRFTGLSEQEVLALAVTSEKAVELAVISWIRHRDVDTPLLSAAFLVFLAGILIGNS